MLAVNDTVSVCHSNKRNTLDYTSVSLPALQLTLRWLSGALPPVADIPNFLYLSFLATRKLTLSK